MKNAPKNLSNAARAFDDLARLAGFVVLAQTDPLTELLVVGNLEQRDAVLAAQRLHELGVSRFVAVFCQNAVVGGAPVNDAFRH